ncbi:HAMP domain-containing sensor histidine kinase [Azotosporobacter soli]|uniref:sensor histidine kinase n=1 Tax=Azotosporobacter soli TaxID=3055040 RepID=UPI0031FF0F4B
MRSIRTRLFRNITCLILCFVLAVWALGALFMEDFYLWQKKSSLIENSRRIAALYAQNDPSFSLEMNRIANHLGTHVVILDAEGHIKQNTFSFFHDTHPEGPDSPPPPRGPRPSFLTKSQETIDADTTIALEHDQMLRIDFMALEHKLPNGDLLLLKLPLPSIKESAAYANRFLSLTAFFFLLAGSLWAYRFARDFTAPLLELDGIAQNMSRLDFSRTCSISTQDELGNLGQSINHLSGQLSQTIYELNEKNEQLTVEIAKEKQLDSLRKTFVSSVSHELKTPIALILGYAEGLKEDIADDAASKDYYASVIVDEAEKMDRLVKDLLNLSQLEGGYFHLEKTDFDLSSLIDAVLQPYQSLLLEKKIRLCLEKPSVQPVHGDILRTEQVLLNLLTNALDHVDIGGELAIRCQIAGEHCRVSVYNSGSQIPSDAIDHLWQSFYKADPARTRHLGGYGLGLSIVRAIQELHGNAYGVANQTDGVLFWVDFRTAAAL